MISRPWLWVLLLAVFLLGLLVGQTPQFNTTQELNAGDLFGAFVTLLVAFALSVVFHRNFSEARVEKDLLMGQVREVISAMKATRELFLTAYIEGTSERQDRAIIAALRNVSSYLSVLESAAAECDVDYRAPSLNQAREEYRRCRVLLTNRALVTGTSYTLETYGQAESAFASFNRALFTFSIFVNKR